MADLRPLGSEKLQGMDKIQRILEIARYNEPTQNINESKADYTIQLADGNYYGIVHEKNGYIVKKGINESSLDYIEPMKNRKYHSSYSQAMKKINLLAGELNRIHEHTENISLIGEQKKFVLKTPKSSEASMSDMGGTPPAPAEDTLPPAPGGDDELDLDLPSPEGGDEELDLGMDTETPEGDDEETSFKSIQKLTGKLGQKLRSLDQKEGLTSENIKYVLNSIISAVDLENLSEEDKDDILANFEEEIDYDMEGDVEVPAGDEELDLGLGDMEGEEVASDEGELGEGARYYGSDDFGWFDGQGKQYGPDDMDFDYEDERDFDFETLHKFAPHLMDRKSSDLGDKSINNLRLRYKNSPMDSVLDEIFAESKVDKVLSKYFVISEEEKKETESKNVKKFITEKIQKTKVISEIKEMSETFEQELTSQFIMKENKNIKFLGKTNKNNLVFEVNGTQLKVTTQGELL